MISAYPKRDSFFSCRFIRLLVKTTVAQTLGPDVFVLLTTIASTEDAKRYKGAVNFHNVQLLQILGAAKWERLDAVRKKAVEAGWLHYEAPPMGSREPGYYWVTIPADLDDVPDSPVDEVFDPSVVAYKRGYQDGRSGNQPQPYPKKGEGQQQPPPANGYCAGYCSGDCQGECSGDCAGYCSGELPNLSLTPIPKENTPENPAPPPETLLALIDGWNALPESVVAKGNRARRDPPAKENLSGWKRAQKNPDLKAAFEDLPALFTAIRGATFCHGQGWFTLPKLFGKNKDGELIAKKILAGGYVNGNTKDAAPCTVYQPMTIPQRKTALGATP